MNTIPTFQSKMVILPGDMDLNIEGQSFCSVQFKSSIINYIKKSILDTNLDTKVIFYLVALAEW